MKWGEQVVKAKRLVDSFIKLTGIDSESGEEAAIRDYLMQLMQEWGYSGQEDEAGGDLNGSSGNLLFRIPATGPGAALLFSCHMDTVKPGKGIVAELGADGLIRSTGDTILGSDDKAGIAAILELIELLREHDLPHPALEILFTVCEEQGLLGARHFQLAQLKAQKAFVLDSGGLPGSIVVQSPSQYDLTYRVRGRAAHAGMHPERGLNAIQIMAKAIAAMPCGRLDEATTCNFGIIAGGQARNVVAADCWLRGEARSLYPEVLEALVDELESLFLQAVRAAGAEGRVERKLLYTAVGYDTDSEIVKLARQAAENLGLPVSFDRTGGGSDASIINQQVPCLNLGIGMSGVHTVDECIHVDHLVETTRWLMEIIRLEGAGVCTAAGRS